MTGMIGKPHLKLLEFVAELPGQLHTDEYLDLADELAKRPRVWALWPGTYSAAPKIDRPGQIVTLNLLGEGPGGSVEFTRRSGRTYCRWVEVES